MGHTQKSDRCCCTTKSVGNIHGGHSAATLKRKTAMAMPADAANAAAAAAADPALDFDDSEDEDDQEAQPYRSELFNAYFAMYKTADITELVADYVFDQVNGRRRLLGLMTSPITKKAFIKKMVLGTTASCAEPDHLSESTWSGQWQKALCSRSW